MPPSQMVIPYRGVCKMSHKVSELRDRLLKARKDSTLMTPAEMVSAINKLSGLSPYSHHVPVVQ